MLFTCGCVEEQSNVGVERRTGIVASARSNRLYENIYLSVEVPSAIAAEEPRKHGLPPPNGARAWGDRVRIGVSMGLPDLVESGLRLLWIRLQSSSHRLHGFYDASQHCAELLVTQCVDQAFTDGLLAPVPNRDHSVNVRPRLRGVP